VADSSNNRIRKIDESGRVVTMAGVFAAPIDLALDGVGNLYVADCLNHRIRKIDASGKVTTLAGSGKPDFADGDGMGASFNNPHGIAVDRSGNVYVADTGNERIRKVTPSGNVTTIAGSGKKGCEDGYGSAASFNSPWGVAVDANGAVYVGDQANNKIRKIYQY